MRIIIIGGGASGMMAALSVRYNSDNEVILLERQNRVGRKLLSTGNGRCNISNKNVSSEHYHGEDPDFCRYALDFMDYDRTMELFSEWGLLTVCEDSGRTYPYSNQANSVLDVLRFSLENLGVRVVTSCEVTAVSRNDAGFTVLSNAGDFACDKLIVAAGGGAFPKLGGTMDGYTLLESLGHTKTELRPSLVQLVTKGKTAASLKGIRADANIRLTEGDTVLAELFGEVQFTDTGLSGPGIFDISRKARENMHVSLDLLAPYSKSEVFALLRRKTETYPHLPAGELFTGILHNRLGKMIVKNAGVSQTLPLGQLTNKDMAACVQTVKNFAFIVLGTQGFESAQVTAGGIKTGKFSPETMESRIVPGLYACGEVLDVDGDCGGYNLQWAWSSGYLAGYSACMSGQ